uniref:Uncharacterized protein n=1 Tax=Zea mays TaxID=4577 RepID=A0A804LKY6_MAIZE
MRTCSVGEVAVSPGLRRCIDGAGGRQERQHVAERPYADCRHQGRRERPSGPLHLAGHRAHAVPAVQVPEQCVKQQLPVLAACGGGRAPPPRADLRQRGADHQHERRQRREAQRHGRPADDAQSRAVQQRQGDVERDDRRDPGAAAGHGGGHARQVVGAQRREGRGADGAADVLPRAHQGPRERPERAVHPHHVPAVARHRRRQLGGHERLRDGPDEWEHGESDECQEGPAGLHRRLGAVWPAGDLEEDEENEGEKRQLVPTPCMAGAAASASHARDWELGRVAAGQGFRRRLGVEW